MKTETDKKSVMMRLSRTFILWVAFLIVQWAMTGCTWLTHPPSEDPLARQMVDHLQKSNESLRQYKELASVRLGFQQEVKTISMALAAALPDRLRVELLSVVGQPMTSLVADGHTIRIRPHGEERIYQLRQSPTALERLIHLPIGIEQLQGALIGRPKLPKYRYAQLVEQRGAVIVVDLQSRWRTLARLEFDASNSKVRMLESYDEEGDSLYRIHWIQWRQIGQYQLPSDLRLESNDGYVLTVKMKRFWPDVALSAGTFELKPPNQNP